MSRPLRLFSLPVILAALSLTAQPGRQRPGTSQIGKEFPPEIVLDRFIDVVTVAPRYFSVQEQNSDVRVVRARLAGSAKVPLHDERSGLMVALSDVNLRLTTPDGYSRDIRLRTGETQWIDGDTFREENLNSSPGEFLYVEILRPKHPPSEPPV
ncbi:MAG TPA: hypothetical protein VMH81_18430 [Bryobacteraceae bacterium]|nr:hypothetical protein [Bryobacteraceae bacterium]